MNWLWHLFNPGKPPPTYYTTETAEHRGESDASVVPKYVTKQSPSVSEIRHVGFGGRCKISRREATRSGPLRSAAQITRLRADRAADDLRKTQDRLVEHEELFRKANGFPAPETDRRFSNFWIITGACAAIEAAFSEVVFRSLGESELETVLFSVGVSVSMIGLSHLLGPSLRMRRVAESVTYVVVLACVIGVVGAFRAAKLGASTPNGMLSPAAASFGFAVLNVGLATFATAYAANIHDCLLHKVFRCRAAVNNGLRRLTRLEAQAIQARQKLDTCAAVHSLERGEYDANTKRLIDAYRRTFLSACPDRSEDHYPASFHFYPDYPDGPPPPGWAADGGLDTDVSQHYREREPHDGATE